MPAAGQEGCRVRGEEMGGASAVLLCASRIRGAPPLWRGGSCRPAAAKASWCRVKLLLLLLLLPALGRGSPLLALVPA